jgi:enoyl-CoA hydratase/carnithine racemase
MNEAMIGEAEHILIELEADTAVRVVILTGAGRAFSSGGDQKRDGTRATTAYDSAP